jgi:2,3-bisphosphoglycerate-dependent phosphoglycerate mutase
VPGTLVLLRHGQSALNAAGRFTGLLDPPLTALGRAEAEAAAGLLDAAGLFPDAVFTSALQRSTETAQIVLDALGAPGAALETAWELNERSYGSLTGRDRAQLRLEVGQAAFTAWRRSYRGAPPPMPPAALEALRASPALAGLPPEAVPATESLRDVAARVRRFWRTRIAPALETYGTVLAVAHGNTLRALCLVLDGLSGPEVEALNIPTGQPLLYRFTPRMRPVVRGGTYLDPATALAGAARIAAEGGT